MRHAAIALVLLIAAPAMAAEWVRATVERTDPARGFATLKHERIKSLPMEAMTMRFKVRDPAMLRRLKPGAAVLITVAIVDDEPTVTGVRAAR